MYQLARSSHHHSSRILNLSIQYFCRNQMLFPIYYSTSTRTTLRVFHLADIALVRCGIYTVMCARNLHNCIATELNTLATYIQALRDQQSFLNHHQTSYTYLYRMSKTYRNDSSWRLVLRNICVVVMMI